MPITFESINTDTRNADWGDTIEVTVRNELKENGWENFPKDTGLPCR